MKHVYLAALHALGFTQKQLFQASKEFEDISALYESLSSSQLGKLGIGQDKSQKILEKKENLSVSDLEKVLAQRKVQLVTFFDAEYPESLKQLSSPPFLLYVR
ncbi:MAG: hypothetical protein H6767_01245 [Candidatus Peribacteria bacterium]|nr:MAG: hypothetical protein H6767_01245 [Candidatus Peribacteria bacterium]